MKKYKTLRELKNTRVKTTFKVEIEIDLPYFDNEKFLNDRLKEVMTEVLSRINKDDTDGHFDGEDSFSMGHKYEVFYGYEEEEEYNIHD